MIRCADINDLYAAAELAALLWRGSTTEELADEFRPLLATGRARIFLQYEGGVPIGFAQCQLRHDYVEGTDTSPVGYLEGIFVREGYRRRGYGRALLSACESWARAQGCPEAPRSHATPPPGPGEAAKPRRRWRTVRLITPEASVSIRRRASRRQTELSASPSVCNP